MYCGFFGIRNLCLVCSFQVILHIFTAKDKGGVIYLVSATHSPCPKGRPSRRLPRIGWTPATGIYSQTPPVLISPNAYRSLSMSPGNKFQTSFLSYRSSVSAEKSLSFLTCPQSGSLSIIFLYHPLYSPIYLLFPIHIDYSRLRVCLHPWHRLQLLVSLQ